MIQTFRLILTQYLKINRRWFFPVFFFPVVWRLIFLIPQLDLKFFGDPRNETQFLSSLLVPLAVAQIFLSFGLALSLKRRGNESWFSRLPIKGIYLGGIPYFLLMVQALLIYGLAFKEWNVATAMRGFPLVFLLGVIPVCAFAIVKSFRNSSAGLIAGFVTVGLVFGFVELVTSRVTIIDPVYLRPALELLCVGFIFLTMIYTEERSQGFRKWFGLGLMVTILSSAAIFYASHQETERYSAYFEPLNRLVIDSYKVKSQCDDFSRIAKKTLGDRPLDHFKKREDFVTALAALKDLPKSSSILQTLQPYQTGVPEGLAQVLFLEKIMNLYGCDVIARYDLQRALIQTLAKKDFPISSDEASSAKRELWSNIRQSTGGSPTMIQTLVNSSLIKQLSDNGFIDTRFRLDISELGSHFEEERLSLSGDFHSIYGYKMPSKKQLNKMATTMQRELVLVGSMQERLGALIAKIGEPQF